MGLLKKVYTSLTANASKAAQTQSTKKNGVGSGPTTMSNASKSYHKIYTPTTPATKTTSTTGTKTTNTNVNPKKTVTTKTTTGTKTSSSSGATKQTITPKVSGLTSLGEPSKTITKVPDLIQKGFDPLAPSISQETTQEQPYIPTINVYEIESKRQEYIDALTKAGLAQADKAYEAGSSAAETTKIGSLADLKENYIRGSAQNYQNRQDLENDYTKSRDSVSQDYFNAIQQGRENMASRGLSNSGLGYAIDQNNVAQANQARAQIDIDYNNNVNKLRSELATMVQTYGIGKEKANEIYNRTLESLEAQRQAEITRVIEDAQAKGIQYQTDIDKFNVGAKNQAELVKGQIGADIYMQDKQINSNEKIADMNNEAAMERLKTQLDFDKWNATEQRKFEDGWHKADNALRLQIAQLDSETAKETARISAGGALQAAKISANASMELSKLGLKGSTYQNVLASALDGVEYKKQSTYVQELINRCAGEIYNATTGNDKKFNSYISEITKKAIR